MTSYSRLCCSLSVLAEQITMHYNYHSQDPVNRRIVARSIKLLRVLSSVCVCLTPLVAKIFDEYYDNLWYQLSTGSKFVAICEEVVSLSACFTCYGSAAATLIDWR
jgi:hypothetical protein